MVEGEECIPNGRDLGLGWVGNHQKRRFPQGRRFATIKVLIDM